MQPVILFTQKNSTYNTLGVETFDEKRNALTYSGKNPVICHPPCRLFGSFRNFSTAPGCERLLGIYSVLLVRQIGGIVEQPRGSTLWRFTGVSRSTTQDMYGGFVITVNQHWFGFKAQKATDLYIVGCSLRDIPPHPLNFNAITHSIGNSCNGKKELASEHNATTTESFAKWLIEIASKCHGSNI